MRLIKVSTLCLIVVCCNCKQSNSRVSGTACNISAQKEEFTIRSYDERAGKGALLLTRFRSLEDFKEVIAIHYTPKTVDSNKYEPGKHSVTLEYTSGGVVIRSNLKDGISQADFLRVRNGSIWSKILLGIKCPYALRHKQELISIEHLSRRRPPLFGKGDVAFYDLAEMMVNQISDEDYLNLSCEELSEKGYLNTFNHITAQAFMTSLFSERLADFIADVHELYNMPELTTGDFTDQQLADFENGPVDNYLDMINNEWGQELGKVLGRKYGIDRHTIWTPQLLRDYLNDIQLYHSWAFQIGFIPFRSTDMGVIQFARKINVVVGTI
ncbi:MAG TPA: hypothetical protein VLA46_12225 [Saprospiraceae bacterium]|nr:hypothetical protein [Saprospiraceae bacterium]